MNVVGSMGKMVDFRKSTLPDYPTILILNLFPLLTYGSLPTYRTLRTIDIAAMYIDNALRTIYIASM
jgi:hypothetical protein